MKNPKHTKTTSKKASAVAIEKLQPRGPLMELRFDTAASASLAVTVLEDIHLRVPGIEELPRVDLDELRAVAAWAHEVNQKWQVMKDLGGPEREADEKRRLLIEESRKLKNTLTALSDVLVDRGVIKEADRALLVLGGTWQSLAKDLQALASLFLRNWKKLEGQVPVTREELEQVEGRFVALKRALAPRRRGSKQLTALDQERRRAFTILFERYGELAKGAEFLRFFEGDAATLVPSLHVRRAAKKAAKADAAPDTSELKDASTTLVKDAPAAPSKATPAVPPKAAPDAAPADAPASGEPVTA